MDRLPLHIGFLTSEYIIPPNKLSGGLASYIYKVSHEFISRGHNVSVFCLSDRNNCWIDEGVTVHEIRSKRRFFPQVLTNILNPFTEFWILLSNASRIAKRVIKENKKNSIDIIQTSSYQAVGIKLCNNGRIPIITRISSLEPIYRNANERGEGINTLSTTLTDWCEINQVENSDDSFSPSKLMADFYSSLSQVTPKIIRTPVDKSNPVMDESFYVQNLNNRKYLLYFGTLNRMKGLDIISEAMSGVLDNNPDLHFVFIGRTHVDQNFQPYSKKIVSENKKWEKNIHYFPSLPKEKLYPLVQNAQAILIPSLVDNYPNVCLEALRFGKIIIGTRNTSIDEIITDGKTGILVDKNDVTGLQEGSYRFLSLTKVEKNKMEKNISEYYSEIISEDRIGILLDFYYRVINEFQTKPQIKIITFENLFILGWFYGLGQGFLPIINHKFLKLREYFYQYKLFRKMKSGLNKDE